MNLMKRTLTIMALLAIASFTNQSLAQKTEKKVNVKNKGIENAVKEHKDKCPLAPLYGKNMKIKEHIVNGNPSRLGEQDHMIFHKDGNFEESRSGSASKGSWKWQERNNQISIQSQANSTWNIVDVNAEKVVLSKENEKLTLIRTN